MNGFLSVSEMRLTSGRVNDVSLKMGAPRASKCSMTHPEEFLALAASLIANTVMPYYGTITSFHASVSLSICI